MLNAISESVSNTQNLDKQENGEDEQVDTQRECLARWKEDDEPIWGIVVLATDPDNLPAVEVWLAAMGRFGSRPVQKSDVLTLGGSKPDTYLSTNGFCRVWVDLLVLISRSASRDSHVWSHSDVVVLIMKMSIYTSRFNSDVFAALMIKTNRQTCPTTSWKWASTEFQRLLVMYFG